MIGFIIVRSHGYLIYTDKNNIVLIKSLQNAKVTDGFFFNYIVFDILLCHVYVVNNVSIKSALTLSSLSI